MTPIDKVSNFYKGKLYNRWISVVPLYGQSGVLATKINKGKFVSLLLTENGKKRELLSYDEKIMDVVDVKGQKRTYVYKRDGALSVKGQMFVASQSDKEPPLIVGAKWIAKNCMPERLFLKLNTQNKSVQAFIPAKYLVNGDKADIFGLGKNVNVQEVLAKDFENAYDPLPKTIIFKTDKGSTQAIMADNAEENYPFVKQFGIKSDILGWKLRTMV